MSEIIIGSDHAGFPLKERIKAHLVEKGIPVIDLGEEDDRSVDYPKIARAVAEKVAASKSRGILLCGSGIGMSIAANRTVGIRAALCSDRELARLARAHNDANILVLAGRTLNEGEANEMVDIFLSTPFDGGRHERRVDSIDNHKAQQ